MRPYSDRSTTTRTSLSNLLPSVFSGMFQRPNWRQWDNLMVEFHFKTQGAWCPSMSWRKWWFSPQLQNSQSPWHSWCSPVCQFTSWHQIPHYFPSDRQAQGRRSTSTHRPTSPISCTTAKENSLPCSTKSRRKIARLEKKGIIERVDGPMPWYHRLS